jgi:hypothetical protein
MSATITLNTRLEEAEEYINKNFNPHDEGNHCYFYTGKISPWDDEYSPDISTSSYKEIYDTKFQKIFLKKLTIDNTSLCIKRFNWETNTKYTRADYNVEYTDYRHWIHPESPFYVLNSEGNVYKCISNNNGTDSTEEPLGQSLTYIVMGDGYVWKFMFALNTNMEDTFLTDNWIPVPYRASDKDFTQNNVESNAVIGDIPYIHLDNAGDGYTSAPIIEIRGDGSGATASAVMNGESIDSIQISNAGTGYTYADVYIFGNGYDAKATAMIAPHNGHGSDAKYELGAFYVEVNTEIVGDEDGFAPITGSYRQIGITRNILLNDTTPITDDKLNTLSVINISDCSGTYLSTELVIGETSYAQGIVYFDPGGVDKDITMIMVQGDFIDGETLHGQDTGESGTYNEALSTITDVDLFSGDLLYKENIIFVTRREIQIENFTFTIEF